MEWHQEKSLRLMEDGGFFYDSGCDPSADRGKDLFGSGWAYELDVYCEFDRIADDQAAGFEDGVVG